MLAQGTGQNRHCTVTDWLGQVCNLRPNVLIVCDSFAVAPAPTGSYREGVLALPDHEEATLWYRVVRPELLASRATPPPLVVLHGGPQVPSDYLWPLENVDAGRAVLFYDQLGCGRSGAPPKSSGCYGIDASVRDLRALLQTLNVDRYHLLGQSWGGMLAFEHLRAVANDGRDDGGARCLSLTLSNTPTSVALVEEVAAGLAGACADFAGFESTHVCRLEPRPGALDAAYAHAGTTWRGSGVLAGWSAEGGDVAALTTPALVIRGEHDFVTDECVAGWAGLPRAQTEVLRDASHHSLLEQPSEYCALVAAFLREHDSA